LDVPAENGGQLDLPPDSAFKKGAPAMVHSSTLPAFPAGELYSWTQRSLGNRGTGGAFFYLSPSARALSQARQPFLKKSHVPVYARQYELWDELLK